MNPLPTFHRIAHTLIALLLLPVEAHEDGAAEQLGVVEGLHSLGGVLGGRVLDDAVALAAGGALLLYHVRAGHGAYGLEVVLEFVPLRPVVEVANVEAVVTHSARVAGLAVLADENGSALELGVVELVEGVLRVLHGSEGHQATALAAAVGLGQHIGVLDDAPEAAHVVLQVLPRHVPGEVADVQAAGLTALAASGRGLGDVPGGSLALLSELGRSLPLRRSLRSGLLRGTLRASAGALLAILANENKSSVQVSIVQGSNGLLGICGTFKLDDAAALRAAVCISHDIRSEYSAGLLHVIFQILPRDFELQVSDVHSGAGTLTRTSLGSGSLSPVLFLRRHKHTSATSRSVIPATGHLASDMRSCQDSKCGIMANTKNFRIRK